MIAEADILDALKDCYDPEIPVNIVDLGLIYDVDIEEKNVLITMTLTGHIDQAVQKTVSYQPAGQ